MAGVFILADLDFEFATLPWADQGRTFDASAH